MDLSHEERQGLKHLIDRARREACEADRLRASGRAGYHRDGLLHGSAVSWPPQAIKVRGPSVDPTYDYVRLGIADRDL